MKSLLIDAALKEIGPTTARLCNAPSKKYLINTRIDQPLDWDPILSFCRNPCQSQDSYQNQLFGIRACVNNINDYCNIIVSRYFTKNIGLRGIPGGGKTFHCIYCILYIISLGLK